MFDTAGRLCVLFLVSCSCVGGSAQTTNLPPLLEEVEQAAVVEALRCLKMTPADLSYKKDYAEAPYRLTKVQRFLEQPLELVRKTDETMSKLSQVQTLGSLAAFASEELELPGSDLNLVGPRNRLSNPEPGDALPEPLRPALSRLVSGIELAERCAANTFKAIPVESRQRAVARYAATNLRLDEDKSEAGNLESLNFGAALIAQMLARDDDLETEDDEYARDLLPVFANIEREQNGLVTAARALAHEVETAIQLLNRPEVLQSVPSDAKIRIETRLGPIFIGGAGRTQYTEDALLIIDLGGDDRYDCRAGAADGLIGRPVSIVIDLAGNDHYRSGTLSQGAGVFGIGILVDCGGDDSYEAKHLSQGAGLYGVGILADYAGNDSYTGDINAQGAGMFGVGILWDRGGDDRYSARQSSQGFGYTGGLGLLLDGGGNDNYTAGGKYADHERLPEHFLSCSQGFGYGMRPDAGGGIGILCDLAGNDIYTTDIYGQGVGYFYSLGMLLDAQGNDVYRCYQYGQGAGIHLAEGILADWQGDDRYEGQAIVQGAAHDWSVGMLFDKQGNDQYMADSTAQGSALYNSVAMLVDSAGNDLYLTSAGKNTQAAGHDGERREYGTIAMLLDLGGTDTYSNGPRENFIALKPLHGCAMDTEEARLVTRDSRLVVGVTNHESRITNHSPPFASTPTGLSRPRNDEERRWLRLIRQATEYSDTDKKAREKALAYEQLRRDAAAVLPFWLRQLDHDALMVRVRLDEFMDATGATNAAPALIEALQSPSELVRRQACYYVGKLKVGGAVELLRAQLGREKVRAIALWALGELKASSVLEDASKYRNDPQESVRMRAAAALGKLGNPRAVPHLIAALDDELWDVRYVAQAALIKIGKPALRPMLAALPKASARARPYLIEAIGRVGDARAADSLRSYLRSDDWLVRGTTVAAITDLKPTWWPATRKGMLQSEKNLFVLSRLQESE